jgi:sRNA-binding protein
MTSKSILLGSAILFALSGAAYAQADSPQADSSQKPAARVVHHVRHHMRHRIAVAKHETVAERRATRDLNLEQANMVRSEPQYEQNAPRPNPNAAPIKYYPGTTYNAGATPGGGGPQDNVHTQPH